MVYNNYKIELFHYFGEMVDLAEFYGGSVVRFSGDALTVLFAASEVNAAVQAVQCALEMQERMTHYQNIATSAGKFSLAMKAGLAVGPVVCTSAGDAATRLEFIVAGEVLERAAAAEHHSQPGWVVVHNELAPHLGAFTGEAITADFTRLTGLPRQDRCETRLPLLPPPPAPKMSRYPANTAS